MFTYKWKIDENREVYITDEYTSTTYDSCFIYDKNQIIRYYRNGVSNDCLVDEWVIEDKVEEWNLTTYKQCETYLKELLTEYNINYGFVLQKYYDTLIINPECNQDLFYDAEDENYVFGKYDISTCDRCKYSEEDISEGKFGQTYFNLCTFA